MQAALRSHCLQSNISVNWDGALFTVAFSYIVFKDEPNKNQGGRSCAGAQGDPSEKFGLGQKF